MKILLHCCCGPCVIYPLVQLRAGGHEVHGCFSNHIHPYTEWQQRLQTLQTYATEVDLPLIVDDRYRLPYFLRNTVYRETQRCTFCYHDRLEVSAKIAKRGKFDAFTSTLLYSKFQQHELIREMGEAAGKAAGMAFYYEDFRAGWKAGIEESKERQMYRQQYCGCIYSEGERYLGRKWLTENA
ncbi:MAG: epoxyqueuosine reductase QueH [Deltaproteobacteria bacterium]|nr:epoxyqueuosine reductase QueH [Candidatus Anaeroferrophillus wilburensis]MBN2888757.1 epoxyqueuosine reductase QueH [Deltaproteobacteria bacterium]